MPSEEQYEAFLKALGARIRLLRRERGMTMRDIVMQHGYHDAQWRKYEGGGSLNVKTLLRIAEILEQPIRNLFPEVIAQPGSREAPTRTKRPAAKKGAPNKAVAKATDKAAGKAKGRP